MILLCSKPAKRFMVIWLTVLLFLGMLPGLILKPVPAHAGELPTLLNGGFEQTSNGLPTGWAPFLGVAESATDMARSGASSVKLIDESATGAAGLRSGLIEVTAGQTYSATVYSYNAQGVSQLYLEYWDASNNYTKIYTASNTRMNQWGQIEVSGVAPPGTVYASLRLYLHVGNVGTAYFDDAAFVRVLTEPASSLLNGDLEELVNGEPVYWNLPESAETTTEQVYSGASSVKVVDSSSSSAVLVRSHRIAVTAGQLYEASVWSYNVEGVSQLYLEFWDENDSYTGTLFASNTTLNQWRQLQVRGVVPEQSAYATIRFYLHKGNIGTAYFDAAAFRWIPPEPGAHLANGSFELSELGRPEGWSVGGGNVELSQRRAKDGVNSMKLTMTEEGSLTELRSRPVRVYPGDPYEASVHTTVYDQTYQSGGAPELLLEFRDQAGEVIGTVHGVAESVYGDWQRWAAEGIAPNGASNATLRLAMTPGAEGASLFDDARLVRTSAVTNAKIRSTYYTPAKVAAARLNVQQYEWAAELKDSAVLKANKYLAKGTDYLWNTVTGPELPRSYGVNQALGSPVTGRAIDAYGNYPYKADPLNEPWKIVDPSSGYKFPTNDFGAYYSSGLDEHGLFRPELADRSLLVNTLYPEKGPTWGVDDGFGWVDENGNRYTFIAYYNHWFLWYGDGVIREAVKSLSDAYLYTGDSNYARAGIALLDRIADVYPDMDTIKHDMTIFLNSHGGTGQGKAVGSIWETGLVKVYIAAYDAFYPAFDDPTLIAYLDDKAIQYRLTHRKGTASAIRKNIEDGILRQVYPAVQTARIRGNHGMHQSALAMAAVVYDKLPETRQWIDFIFQSGGFFMDPPRITGGDTMNTLVGIVDRDGVGYEAAVGYNALWLDAFRQTADILEGYDLYPSSDLYTNPKFVKMFSALYPLVLSGDYMPSIGDFNSTGNPGISAIKLDNAVKAFIKFGDPLHAQMAHFLNGGNTQGIHLDVFSEDPEAIAEQIRSSVALHGPLKLHSSNETGYGFAALQDGEKIVHNFGLSFVFPDLDVVSQTTALKLFPASGTLQLESTAPGDTVVFQFQVEETDDYEIALLPFTATVYGMYRISIDGQPVEELDFYGSENEHAPYIVLDRQVLTAGAHTIAFEGIGKNSASGNYKMGVRSLNLLDAQAREERDNARPEGNWMRDVWMYYGRSTAHGHADTLNLGMHAFGLDLAPDLGYPEAADSVNTHRAHWVNNTISHNTVVVDKTKQAKQWVAQPKHFDDSEWVKLMDVEAPDVYPQTELYKRTTAMIRLDDANFYAADFFRVVGGSDHHFSFHGAEGAVAATGLSLTAQPTGTYAGPNVEYGQRVDSVGGPGYLYQGSGFHYLKNVERDTSPPGQFSLDWDVEDTWNALPQPQNVHLRLTMLADLDEVALADGIPAQNRPGNPQSLRYMIAHRSGTNLDSLFTSILEPYLDTPTIAAIVPATVKDGGTVVSGNEARAVKITMTSGRVDYVVSAMHPEIAYTIDDTLQFKGFFGVYAKQNNEELFRYVNDGSYFAPVGETVSTRPGALQGVVASFTGELSASNEIVVDMDAQGTGPQDWVGRFIYVDNDGVRNAAYPIIAAADLGGGRYKLDIGDHTLIRSYVDPNQVAQGYLYDIAPAAAFRIPLSWDD